MNPEVMTLSEISQTQKDKRCLTPLTGGPWWGQVHRDRKHNGGFEGLGGREKTELMFNGHRVSVLQDEKLRRWMVVMVVQQCEHT